MGWNFNGLLENVGLGPSVPVAPAFDINADKNAQVNAYANYLQSQADSHTNDDSNWYFQDEAEDWYYSNLPDDQNPRVVGTNPNPNSGNLTRFGVAAMDKNQAGITDANIRSWVNATRDFYTSDKAAFDQWARENPVYAARFYAEMDAQEQKWNQFEAAPALGMFNPLSFSGLSLDDRPANPYGEDYRAKARSYAPSGTPYRYGMDEYSDINTAGTSGDFFKLGRTGNTASNSLGDFVRQNPLETAGLVALAAASSGLGNVIAGPGAAGAATSLGAAGGAALGAGVGSVANQVGGALLTGSDVDIGNLATGALTSAAGAGLLEHFNTGGFGTPTEGPRTLAFSDAAGDAAQGAGTVDTRGLIDLINETRNNYDPSDPRGGTGLDQLVLEASVGAEMRDQRAQLEQRAKAAGITVEELRGIEEILQANNRKKTQAEAAGVTVEELGGIEEILQENNQIKKEAEAAGVTVEELQGIRHIMQNSPPSDDTGPYSDNPLPEEADDPIPEEEEDPIPEEADDPIPEEEEDPIPEEEEDPDDNPFPNDDILDDLFPNDDTGPYSDNPPSDDDPFPVDDSGNPVPYIPPPDTGPNSNDPPPEEDDGPVIPPYVSLADLLGNLQLNFDIPTQTRTRTAQIYQPPSDPIQPTIAPMPKMLPFNWTRKAEWNNRMMEMIKSLDI